jgi:uncharacterized membrane protein
MTKKTERIFLFTIFAVCLAIRIAFINQKNLWFDEVFSWHLTLGSFYEIVVRTSADIHPPLYYFLLKIWSFVFGDSVISLRLLSALFMSLAVFFIYPVSRRVLSSENSFFVLLLYCVSPLNVYYAQEVRMAAMNLFLNAGSVYFLLRLTDNCKEKIPGFKACMQDINFFWYVILTTSALYTHYFSFFILAAEISYVIYLNKTQIQKYYPYLTALCLVGIFYSLWLGTFIWHISKGQAWRVPQTLMQVLNEYSNYFKDLNFGLYYHYTNLNLVKYTAIILSIGLLLAIIGLFFKRKSERYDKSIALIVLTTFVPLILAGIISYKQKVEFYRYLSILVPFILIVIVYGISKWNSKVLTLTVTGCFIAANIFGLNLHYSFEFKNDDYRSLIDQINSEYKAGDRIYVEPHYYRWFIEYYNKQNNIPVKPVFIRYGWGEVMDSINVQKPERFWVVFDYSSVDTSKYNQYISGLNSRFKQDFNMTYYLAPVRVELYRYIKK